MDHENRLVVSSNASRHLHVIWVVHYMLRAFHRGKVAEQLEEKVERDLVFSNSVETIVFWDVLPVP